MHSDEVEECSATPQGYFIRFPNFQTELRMKIWRYALPGPRCVELLAHPERRFSNEIPHEIKSLPGSEIQFSLTSPVVPLMGANRESREVALAVYRVTALNFLRLKPRKEGEGRD